MRIQDQLTRPEVASVLSKRRDGRLNDAEAAELLERAGMSVAEAVRLIREQDAAFLPDVEIETK